MSDNPSSDKKAVHRVVGIDVGGTFTDIAVLENGKLTVHKLSSTPSDPSKGILQGVRETGVTSAEFVHGSTVATNALLERKGSRTALVTTMGFEDVLEIGRQSRSELYNFEMDRAPALAPWELRFGLPERIDHTGSIVEDLTSEAIETLIKLLENSEPEAVAVSFLFSFLNTAHEEMVLSALEKMDNPPYISISSRVLPEFREYERTTTVVVNAYVGKVMSRYLKELEGPLGKGLRIMQSSGGSITAGLASEQPVRTILSGPAGGVVGAFYTAVQAGYTDIITVDMGGTSTDVSLCPGEIKETTSANVGGYPIGVPMIDIHTVGAGGGSIARIDAGGALVVGPESAGAEPGPACYGRGKELTVTDANLHLGRLIPDQFLGGRMTLDRPRVGELMKGLASKINADANQTALGINRVVNANMERAIRSISLERGYDPRLFTLVPFGGAGPMHACELAQELSIPRVLVPYRPGILSALGVAMADIVKDYSRTVMLRGMNLDRARIEEEFEGMEAIAKAEMTGEGIAPGRMVTRRFLDVRYVGQSFELTLEYPSRRSNVDFAKLIGDSFYKSHLRRFGYADRNEPVEVVNLRIKLDVPMEKPSIGELSVGTTSATDALIGEANVIFQEGGLVSALYHRDRLVFGNHIVGPALIIQMDSTTVIPPSWEGQVDTFGNLILELR